MLNIAYAIWADRLDARDAVQSPVLLAAGVKPESVQSHMHRPMLDDWLDAPMGEEAEAEAALLAFLTGPA